VARFRATCLSWCPSAHGNVQHGRPVNANHARVAVESPDSQEATTLTVTTDSQVVAGLLRQSVHRAAY